MVSPAVLDIKMKGKTAIWPFLRKKLSTTISMKRSRRELSIDMVIHRGIIKNNKIKLFLCFTSIQNAKTMPKLNLSKMDK